MGSWSDASECEMPCLSGRLREVGTDDCVFCPGTCQTVVRSGARFAFVRPARLVHGDKGTLNQLVKSKGEDARSTQSPCVSPLRSCRLG